MADEIESTPSAPAVAEAPPASSVEAPEPEAVYEDPGANESESGPSIAEAFAAAKAELEGTATPESASDTPAASSEPVGDETPPPAPVDTKVEGQTSLDIKALREALENGTEATLPVEGRQLTKLMRERFAQEQAQEQHFRDLYVGYLTEEVEDPEAFSKLMKSDRRVYEFVTAYEKAHPDVTLENPQGVRSSDPARLRAEIDAEYVTVVSDMAEYLARENGVSNFAEIRSASAGKVGALLQTTFNAAVEAAVQKALPARVAEERIAITQELTARFAQTRVTSPRVINGQPVNGAANKPVDPDENPLRGAFEEAKLELEGKRLAPAR